MYITNGGTTNDRSLSRTGVGTEFYANGGGNGMSLQLNLRDVQKYLQQQKLDGWLIYDFAGLNKVALEIIDLGGHFISRRWFYYIPAQGEPVLLLHKIETTNFPAIAGKQVTYAGRHELVARLGDIIRKGSRIAMEYSPENAIPTVSYVDAGTFELIRQFGAEIVSSANLVQYFTCRLDDEGLASHKRAVTALYDIQAEAFQLIESKLKSDGKVSEYAIQQFITGRFREHGFVSNSEPIVARNGNASNPHYSPSAQVTDIIRPGDCILIDLWAKEDKPGAIYGDITWCGFAGQNPPEQYVEIWTVARDAREAGLALLQQAHDQGKTVQAFEIDAAVRAHITEKGYGEYFFHRTGHSIGEDDHGKGANIDDYESRDLRDIIPGLLFSIEPGIYLPDFGIRTEIDVYYDTDGPKVFTPRQTDLILMDI